MHQPVTRRETTLRRGTRSQNASVVAGTVGDGGFYTLDSKTGTYQRDTDVLRGVSAFLVEETAADEWLMVNIPENTGVPVSHSQR